MTTAPTVLSLFCGGGGFDMGFVRAGFRVVRAFDSDDDALRWHMLNKALTGGQSRWADLSELPFAEYPEADVWIGGPPCQSYSNAGKRGGFNDERGKLLLRMAEALKARRPRAFVIENVASLLNRANKEAFLERVLFPLEDAFALADVMVLNTLDFGLPQKRERVFVVGFRDDRDARRWLQPWGRGGDLAVRNILQPWQEVPERCWLEGPYSVLLARVPPGGHGRLTSMVVEQLIWRFNARRPYLADGLQGADEAAPTVVAGYATTPSQGPYIWLAEPDDLTRRRADFTPERKGKWWGFADLCGAAGTMTVGEQGRDQNLVLVSGSGLHPKYRVYAPRGVSCAITANGDQQPSFVVVELTGEHSEPVKLGYVNAPGNGHGGEANRVWSADAPAPGIGTSERLVFDRRGWTVGIRRLTPRECARLQGFPDEYRLPESITTAHRIIGNAVSVPVARALAERIKRAIR